MTSRPSSSSCSEYSSSMIPSGVAGPADVDARAGVAVRRRTSPSADGRRPACRRSGGRAGTRGSRARGPAPSGSHSRAARRVPSDEGDPLRLDHAHRVRQVVAHARGHGARLDGRGLTGAARARRVRACDACSPACSSRRCAAAASRPGRAQRPGAWAERGRGQESALGGRTRGPWRGPLVQRRRDGNPGGRSGRREGPPRERRALLARRRASRRPRSSLELTGRCSACTSGAAPTSASFGQRAKADDYPGHTLIVLFGATHERTASSRCIAGRGEAWLLSGAHGGAARRSSACASARCAAAPCRRPPR